MIKNTLKKSLALGLLMTFLITGSVWAEGPTTDITAKENNQNITLGSTVKEKPSSSGSTSATTSTNIVAMGKDIDYEQGSDSLVLLGKTIKADGKRLVYIGSEINQNYTEEYAKDAIKNYIINFLKDGNYDDTNDTNKLPTNSNLVGIGSIIDITGRNSVAIGMGVDVHANNSVAIGPLAEVTTGANNSVAIGAGSVAKNELTVSFGRDAGTIAGVQVNEINRTLTHVAKGTLSSTSTDAVNGSQLYEEAIKRKSADDALGARITEEAIKRKSADDALSARITNETNARINADQLLQNQIDATNDRTGGITRNAEDTITTIEENHKFYKDGNVSLNNGKFTLNSNGDTYTAGSATVQNDLCVHGDAYVTDSLNVADNNFMVASDGNTTITGTLDVTSTSGQFAVKDDYVATRVTRGTSNNATTAGSINTGGFIGERVKNSDGSEFTATGKNTYGIINVAYKKGISTDVIQTANGINVTTLSHPNPTLSSQTDRGTEITGTNISIEDPTAPTSNRIYLSDVGQVKNVDAELKANSNYVDSPTVVGAINAEADIRRAQFAKLGNKIEKVGAGAAALAAMHPLDFDPDDKLQFSAGVGNYGGETATALGAFYRPTEKVMFNIAGTMGNDENMMNAGITFALDGRNNVSNSRVAMAREIQDLRAQVAQLTNNQAQMMALLNKVLDGQADELLANVMFPDVPENHWAYEYLNSLQKRGIIKGYPDGSFGGDRSLTRYEYAAMLCRVLAQGISVDTRLLDEFEAELGRIRIDRIKGKDNSANKIERVRVNSSSDRDDYGSKIINTSAPAAN